MRIIRKSRLAACRALAVIFGMSWAAVALANHASDRALPPAPEQQALVLLPSDTVFPWSASMLVALRAALERPKHPVRVLTEQIDVTRISEPVYTARLREWLELKYRDTRIDLIFSAGPTPTAFLEQHMPAAWRGVPLVVITNPQVAPRPQLPSPATGFISAYDVRGTVAEALQMTPGARQVAVISGASEYERFRHRSLEPEIRAGGAERTIDLGGLRFPELLARVASLPADAIIVFLGFRLDAEGRALMPDRAAEAISKAANRPVFSTFEPLIGRGIAGGRVVNFEALGAAMAELGLRILGGEDPRSIPFTRNDFTSSVYDWRELTRWGIAPSDLPPGAEVRHRQPTAWEAYRWQILAVVVALMVQAALIAALLLERERRRRAEAHARRTLAEIAHVDRVAALGELTTSLAHELNQPLAAILANAQAARNLLQQDRPDLDEVRASLDDIVNDDKRAGEVIRRTRALLKKEEFRPEAIRLNKTVREVLRLLAQDAARREVVLTSELQPGLPPVQGDAIQLQQVVINLIMNAFDAVAAQPPESRRVVVRTYRAPSGQVELAVEDDGEGIVPKNASSLFDPFFTTKRDGLGMGLSIVRSILELHGGRIEAENLPGGGARFRCVLPPFGAPA